MDFEAEDVVRLREEILRFVLQQLKETAATGELRKASAELAAPIGDAVEAAVQRAMERSGAAKARLGEVEIKQIARAVAAQLGSKGSTAFAAGPGGADPAGDDADLGGGYYASTGQGGRKRAGRFDLEQLIGLGLALLLGIAVGVGLAKFMSQPDQSLVGSEAAEVVPVVQPVATSDSDLQQVEAPSRPAASARTEPGSQ